MIFSDEEKELHKNYVDCFMVNIIFKQNSTNIKIIFNAQFFIFSVRIIMVSTPIRQVHNSNKDNSKKNRCNILKI